MRTNHYAPPQFSRRFIPIWRRNFMVWKKMAGSSILGHLADPVIYMLGLGYGLGGMLPNIDFRGLPAAPAGSDADRVGRGEIRAN